jgi:hypothetical protein
MQRERKKNAVYFGLSKRITGFGFWVDLIPPITVYEVAFVLHFDLLWIRFWWVKYKS